MQTYAVEMVHLPADVILAGGSLAVAALQRGIHSISDRVRTGRRSAQPGYRRKPRASGQQRDGFHEPRLRDEREMA
jgi:hypothetical protein